MQTNTGDDCKFMIHQLCRSLVDALSLSTLGLDGVSAPEISKESRSMSVRVRVQWHCRREEKEYFTAGDAALCCQGRDWSDNGQASRQWQSTRRWSNLIIISEGFLLMRNGYTIIDRSSSSSSSTTLCNITGQLSVGRRVWKLVTHQINQFLSFHHHYIISNQKHHCTALHCEYEATKMLMMDAMVCCISSVAVQNGDWKESADCRSNAEGISTKA